MHIVQQIKIIRYIFFLLSILANLVEVAILEESLAEEGLAEEGLVEEASGRCICCWMHCGPTV